MNFKKEFSPSKSLLYSTQLPILSIELKKLHFRPDFKVVLPASYVGNYSFFSYCHFQMTL